MSRSSTGPAPVDDATFHLCLTHDVDRVYKTFQRAHEAVVDLDPRPLFTMEQPYWQFETIRQIEEGYGVRSSFYFLSERRLLTETHPRTWGRKRNWVLYTGRYDLTSPPISEVILDLHREGWEVGLHGSYTSYENVERLGYEKNRLEEVLGEQVVGGRQHYLNLRQPDTWEFQRQIGLKYDSTLGSSVEYGFQHGYDPIRPFDDEFVVFPLTLMDNPLMRTARSVDEAIKRCDLLLEEAAENGAVMTVDWHQRVFNEAEFPGFRTVYEHLIERAIELGAWVGPCGELYTWLSTEQIAAKQ